MKIALILALAWFPLSAEKYFIAVKQREENPFANLDQYTSFVPPEGFYYADPFLFKHNSNNYIFFEKYNYDKGVIAYVTVDDFSAPQTVLEGEKHLSFPYLFEEGGKIYMIPESSKMREIALFEAVQFPDVWEKRRVLLKGRDFADSILFFYNGYYWLFTSVNWTKLHIYYAESLESPFQAHPINRHHLLGEVVRNAAPQGRNAGRVFFHEGRLIRPVMDCRKIYGEAIMFNEILELTPASFKERTIYRIDPTWAPGLDRTHTFNFNEDFVVYDGGYK